MRKRPARRKLKTSPHRPSAASPRGGGSFSTGSFPYFSSPTGTLCAATVAVALAEIAAEDAPSCTS